MDFTAWLLDVVVPSHEANVGRANLRVCPTNVRFMSSNSNAICYPFVIVSSRFKSTWPIMVHAANSITSIFVGGGFAPMWTS